MVINLTRACLMRGVVTIPYQRRTEFRVGTFTAVDAHNGLFQLTVNEDATISGLQPFFASQDLQPNDDLVLSRNDDDMFMLMVRKKPRFARKPSPPAAKPELRPKRKEKAEPSEENPESKNPAVQEPSPRIPQGHVLFPNNEPVLKRDEPAVPPAEQQTTPPPESPPVTKEQNPPLLTPDVVRSIRTRDTRPAGWNAGADEEDDLLEPEPGWRQAFGAFTGRVQRLFGSRSARKEPEERAEKDLDEDD